VHFALERFDQKVDHFRYNAVLRPALSRAAGFFVPVFLPGTAGVPPAFPSTVVSLTN
jgi:hypothetical protein